MKAEELLRKIEAEAIEVPECDVNCEADKFINDLLNMIYDYFGEQK